MAMCVLLVAELAIQVRSGPSDETSGYFAGALLRARGCDAAAVASRDGRGGPQRCC